MTLFFVRLMQSLSMVFGKYQLQSISISGLGPAWTTPNFIFILMKYFVY